MSSARAAPPVPKRVICYSCSWMPAQVDGVAVRMMAHVRELVSRGAEVLVVSPDFGLKKDENGKEMGPQPLTSIPGVEKHVGMQTSWVPVYRKVMCMRVSFTNFRRWCQIIDTFKPDYVHATQEVGMCVIAAACVLKRVPLVISVHTDTEQIARRDPNFSPFGPTAIGRVHTEVACCFASLGWRLWAVSDCHFLPVSNQAEAILRKAGIPKYQVNKEIWGPMVDRETFSVNQPEDKVKACREELTFGIPNAVLMVYVGRVTDEKDVMFLVDALQRAPDNVVLGLIGPGSLVPTLKQRHGREHRLHCTGAIRCREEVALCMRAADICVSASTMETVGFTAMEALSCGTPMLAANAQGFKEHLSHGRNARLFTPHDPVSFDEELAFMLATASKREGCWSPEELRRSMECASLKGCTDRALLSYTQAKTPAASQWYLRTFLCMIFCFLQIMLYPLMA